MWELITDLQLSIFDILLIPIGGAAIGVIRHYWLQGKCYVITKKRLEQVEKENAEGKEEHDNINDKIDEINKKLYLIMGKLGISIN